MIKLINLLKKDILLLISAILAILSSFFIAPDKEYLSYINFPVLVLLFCLMIVVAGLEKSGVFSWLKKALSNRIKTEKSMVFSLCMLCFFSSALITNDVSLITFVPFSISILKKQKPSTIIFCVVMETISANLGSLITPIGNPQNLYLYTYFNTSLIDFFKITLPLGLICFLMICACFIFYRNRAISFDNKDEYICIDIRNLLIFSFLFLLSILSVLKIISCYITFLVVLFFTLVADRKLFKQADYQLLITFVFFFIFAGNVSRISVIYEFITKILLKREVLVSALISQVVSNVPAAAMLSAFTDDARSLILGTNIGGLGTVIASMASLISYRFIAKENSISKVRYMLTFTVYNVAMLIVLLLIFK